MINVDQTRVRLEERLHELEARLTSIEAELDQPVTKDWEDAAVEREGDETLESLGQSSLHEIEGVRAALARIASGDYGVCVRCGGAIGDERLAALPATPFCRSCAP